MVVKEEEGEVEAQVSKFALVAVSPSLCRHPPEIGALLLRAVARPVGNSGCM